MPGMIALVPAGVDATRMALAGGESADQLHLTLYYLGDVVDLATDQRQTIVTAMRDTTSSGAITADAFGAAVWNPSGDDPCVVANISGEHLEPMRIAVRAALGDFLLPPQYEPWQPHVCLAYDPTRLTDALQVLGPVTFDRLRVAFDDENVDIPLGTRDTVVPQEAAIMPWHKEHGHSGCPSSKPWAVVKDSDGSVSGCHATEDDANAQLAALYGSEDNSVSTGTSNISFTLTYEQAKDLTTQLVGETRTAAADAPVPAEDPGCPPGHHKMPDGSCMPDEAMGSSEDGSWNGVLTVEDTRSGDGRRFAAGSLMWRDLPLPMYWQRTTAPGHDASVIVGSIDRIWRDGNLIRGSGRFNIGGDPNTQNYRDAFDAFQLVRDGFMRGISVTIDDVRDNDVELIWPDEGESGDGFEALFMEPEEAIFHHARIIDGTLTGQPAYQEAFIQLGAVEGPVESVAAAAVATHTTETTDEPWDMSSVLAGVKSRLSAAEASSVYAWVLGEGVVTKAQCMLPHHVGVDGPANIAACSSAIQMLNGGRGGANIPESDRQAVYNHLAQHIRDAGMDPPPLVSLDDARSQAALTASLHVPVTPPAAWFSDPGYTEITPLQVGDDGWVRGHLAKWGTCHTSFAGTCVTPPHEDEFGYFTTGELITREGTRVAVGQLTLGTGHAPAQLGARPAAVHYDHTGFAVADVACGADQFGIWVAGALCPDVDELTVRRLRASALSGDWRRINGQLRLVAALVVNVPGFPIPRTRSHIHDGAQSALVAAGIVQDVERQPESMLLTPKVAELVAATLRAQVMGPKIDQMRARMKKETVEDAV